LPGVPIVIVCAHRPQSCRSIGRHGVQRQLMPPVALPGGSIAIV